MKNSKLKTLIQLLALGAITGLQLACTQTVIVYKPSAQLDPLPKTAKYSVGEAKADPKKEEQWNLEKVGLTAETANTQSFLGNYNVKVALLSTGVDYNHDDLIGQIDVNEKEITQEAIGDKKGVNREDDNEDELVDNVVGYDVVDGDGFAYDRHGAGTAVAGIIAARRNNGVGIAGLMDKVTIYPIRYINDNGQTSLPRLLNALKIASKAKPDVVYIQTTDVQLGGFGQDPKVIKAELSLLEMRLESFKEARIPIIVGAGDSMDNFGSQEMHKILKKYDNIVVVTTSDKNDQLPLMANTSMHDVRTSAPGEGILTTKPLNKYGKVYGTAYAAAHVTAAYALAKSMYGDRYDYEDYNIVLVSAKGSDFVSGMDRFSRGGNRLNIQKFLAELGTR